MSHLTYLIILVLIVFGLGGIALWLNSRIKNFFKIKITHWIILIYVFILLTASLLVPFMPKELTVLDRQKQQDEAQLANGLMEKLENGQLEKIDPKYILAEHRFEGVESPSLTLTPQFENWANLDLYVKRKEENDGIVEATLIQQSFVIDGADFSDLLEPYELKLADDRLTILSTQQNLNLAIMHSPFPVRQLTNTSIMNHSSSRGDQLIYLQIPRDLELEHDEDGTIFINYVN